MNSTFTNVSLFIKRAEEYQDKEFIIKMFESNNIGKVKDVKFIKKHYNFYQNYNGVVVIFERWYMNHNVQTLFSEMSTSQDGSTKFYFNHNRYWIINVHRQKLPECEETTIIDSTLSDKEKIRKLEEVVNSMSAQMFYMQNRQEKNERTMMDLECKHTNHHIINMELHTQLEEKNWEKKWAEAEIDEELQKIRKENGMLRCRLAFSTLDLVRKDARCEKLKQEVRDGTCIQVYIENQIQEMKQLLQSVLDTDPVKPLINTFIKDYLN